MADKKTVDVFGDVLEITWNGSVWVSPSNGQQHARARDAMRVELERYYSACGEDTDDEATAGEIEGHLDDMRDAD